MTAQTVSENPPPSFEFSAENRKKLKAILARYPKNRKGSALIPALFLAQNQNEGWLPMAALEHVGEVLGISLMRVREVATFYTMFQLSPVGKNHIKICTTTPCMLCGSGEIVAACKEALGGVEFREVTEDGLFSMEEVECLGACVNAPLVQINENNYEDLTPDRMREIIETLKEGKQVTPGPQVARQASAPIAGPTTLTSGKKGKTAKV